jgi:Secretion system C-terminal sorting domain
MKKTILLLQVFMLSAFMLSAQTTYLPFTESFEYGIEKWTDGTTGGTVEVTTVESIVGTQSFHMTGTATASKLTNTFSNAIAVNEIMYYIRVAGSGGAVAIFGDGTNNLFYGEVNGGNFVVVDVNGAYAIAPVTSNEWVKVEVKNINYTTYTYEVWINDSIVRSGLEFSSSISGVSQIDLYNTTTSHEAWWDAIYAGIVDYNKPTYTGENVCLGDTANLVFSDDVAFDSLGINVLGLSFDVGPINQDTTVYYKHPYFETTMDDDNGRTAVWAGNMFDITAHDKDLVINAIDVHGSSASGPSAVKVYYRKGSYVGHNLSNAGWLLHDSIGVSFYGGGTATYVDFNKDFVIPKGETYGIFVSLGTGVRYTNATPSNQLIVGEDMTFSGGHGGEYFNLSIADRIWNGRIYYQVVEEQIDTEEVTTIFASNNNYNGNMMDVYAKNDIIIDSLDVNIATSGWVKVYYRNGTCVGNNTSAAGWAMLDSVQVIAAGTNLATKVVLNNRLLIPAGSTYGIYVCAENSMYYTNIIAGTNDVYVDSNMVLTGYYGGTNTFNVTSPRVWNGTMYYTVRNNELAEVGAQTSTYSSGVRGYCFVAPKDFIIKGLMIPNDVTGDQCIEVLRFNDTLPPPFPSLTDNFTSLGYWKNVPQGVVIPCDIYVNKGDYMGVYGKGGSITSYCGSVSTIDILGVTAGIFKSGMQYNLLTEQMHDVFREVSATARKGRVNLYLEDVSKHGGQDSVLIDMHSPSVYLGTDTVICADQTINLDAGSFSTYNWSSGGSAQVEAIDSIGTGIGSTDVWVVVADQYGCEATDTITITFNDCTGIEEEKLLLSVYPNPSKDVFFVSAEGLNDDIYIDVIGMDGRIIKQIVSSDNLTKIDLSTQEPGVYFIRLTIGDQVQVVNVVLQ